MDLAPHRSPTPELHATYTSLEILVAVVAIIGNSMVIHVFRRDRRLKRKTNYYIVSLAIADLLVGLLGIPFAILASVGLPRNLYACLFTTSLLVMLCTISIFCLVAVSVDRYWAILHPMCYSRNVRTQTAILNLPHQRTSSGSKYEGPHFTLDRLYSLAILTTVHPAQAMKSNKR
ncbi:Adenosine receptor A2b [Danaus plexippus plexippus]|uniref:Adenosine receptor A2b n=1 Tax=Danaus plexippus plexippus TaxID=278856 RepID=A0A212EN77_DANPL|nr:Adenosine receptor A2b [Danaus plexippus plexippus]